MLRRNKERGSPGRRAADNRKWTATGWKEKHGERWLERTATSKENRWRLAGAGAWMAVGDWTLASGWKDAGEQKADGWKEDGTLEGQNSKAKKPQREKRGFSLYILFKRSHHP